MRQRKAWHLLNKQETGLGTKTKNTAVITHGGVFVCEFRHFTQKTTPKARFSAIYATLIQKSFCLVTCKLLD